MQRRYSLAHLILCGVVGLGLMLLTLDVEAQARITFMSDRDWERLAVGDLRDGYRWR